MYRPRLACMRMPFFSFRQKHGQRWLIMAPAQIDREQGAEKRTYAVSGERKKLDTLQQERRRLRDAAGTEDGEER